MKNKYRVIPAVLSRRPSQFRSLVQAALALSSHIHVDIMDGSFTRQRTVGPMVLRKTKLSSTAAIHLMVEDPIRWLAATLASGSRTAIIHLEINQNHFRHALAAYRANRFLVGYGLCLETPLTKLADWPKPSWIHVMTGPIGASGKKMNPRALARVRTIRRHFPKARLSTDVGMNPKTIPGIVRAGADEVTVESFLWSHPDPIRQWTILQRQRQNI